jgi:hypothetical protein
LIREKYDEINRLTGANYNIFNVLKLQSDEVRLHSRFIGDLLNPKGKHGRGEMFLELFLEQVKDVLPIYKKSDDSNDYKVEIPDTELSREILQAKKVYNDFNPTKAKVVIEEYIGKVKTDEGGRIDLVVTDGVNTIVIENKIYADDQKQQLIRYYNKYPGALMIYLTLNGKKATTISVTPNGKKENDGKKVLESDVNYIPMSYEANIKEWLEKGLLHTTQFPHLRESFSQYLNIVKQLTGQSINKDMDKEIVKQIFNSTNSISAAKEVFKNFEKGQKNIYKEFRKEIQNELTKKLNTLKKIKFCVNRIVKKKKYEETRTQIIFNNEKFSNCHDKGIAEVDAFKDKLIFEYSRMYKNGVIQKSFYYGFRYDNANNNKEDYKKTADIQRLIDNNMLTEPSSINDADKYWLAIGYRFNNDSNETKFNSSEFMVILNDDKKRKAMVNELVEKMFEVIETYINSK